MRTAVGLLRVPVHIVGTNHTVISCQAYEPGQTSMRDWIAAMRSGQTRVWSKKVALRCREEAEPLLPEAKAAPTQIVEGSFNFAVRLP